jgi:hypothetical protein
MFRYTLSFLVFGAKMLPEHLIETVAVEDLNGWNLGEDLVIEQQQLYDSLEEGLLLRTATTTSEVLSQPVNVDVLKWEDSTTQLCHFLLHKLFGLPNTLQKGNEVFLIGLKNKWLNGAEGTVGDQHPNGRYYVHLRLPKAAVEQASANTGSAVVIIHPDNMYRIAGDADRFSIRRLLSAAESQPGARVCRRSCAEASMCILTDTCFFR